MYSSDFFGTHKSFYTLKSFKNMFINCTFVAYKENQNTLYIFAEDERLLFDTQRCIEINFVRCQSICNHSGEHNKKFFINEARFLLMRNLAIV